MSLSPPYPHPNVSQDFLPVHFRQFSKHRIERSLFRSQSFFRIH